MIVFFEHMRNAAKIAKIAFENDSAPRWQELLGNKFPLSKGPFADGKSDSGDPKPRRYGIVE